jgi:hypothetical protein
VTEQVGRFARSVSEVATELGWDWHSVNDAVVSYGEVLVEDPERIGAVEALGLDEVLFVRRGPRHHQEFSTTITDVRRGQLLDVVSGRGAKEPPPGCSPAAKRGCRTSVSPPWISRAPIARCSTPSCPSPFRWPIRSMS